MSRFVYLPGLNSVDVYDLADGSLQTRKPSHTVKFSTVNGDEMYVEIWSAEALLETIDTYANTNGIRIHTIPAYWEEQIRKVIG